MKLREPSDWVRRGISRAVVLVCLLPGLAGAEPQSLFSEGTRAYERADYDQALRAFAALSTNEPSFGVWLNLGNSQWKLGETAGAIVAWERAGQMDPFLKTAEDNLKFARDQAQLEAPDLTWCEVAAGWLPAGWWAALAVFSLWFAVAVFLLPNVLRWKRATWQQALGAMGLGFFLLTLPANFGVWTRTKLGVALSNETQLQLTPTTDGEPITRLAAGEPARVIGDRGGFLLVQTRRAQGWLPKAQFGWLYPH